MNNFLPMTIEEVKEKGWDGLDFILVTADAYVDHPSFANAIIGRVLEAKGFRIGIIAQPDWNNIENFKKLGTPELGFLVSGGNIDSMVNHYTASKKPRSQDVYSPGGKAGLRPDRPTIVYCNKIRQAFGKIPIIIGGVEASLRRFAHYDYWDDKVRRSILIDCGADILVYGMGEKSVIEIAGRLKAGEKITQIIDMRGTVFISDGIENLEHIIETPSYEDVIKSKEDYAKAFNIQYAEQDPFWGKTIVQKHREKYIVQNPPQEPLSQKEMDWVYSLSFQRMPHPSYTEPVPAIEEVQFSITSSRGCFGSCSFCALTFHQGRIIQSRSHPSIINEAQNFVWDPNFKGYIHDVGGPTANFRNTACKKQQKVGACKNKHCLFPKICDKMDVDHGDYLELLKKLRAIRGIKKVFVRSGIRYDYLIADKNEEFFEELCKHHVSGQLKVAPEHISQRVLEKMGKPGREIYEKFVKKFYQINKKIGKEQYLVPYLMSSHPGSDLKAAIELAEFIRDTGIHPEQVQDFYPTPGTLSTCMFYTGFDPRTMEKVYSARSPKEKAMQRALLQYRNPANYDLVYEALIKAGRSDLIGYDKKCLIRPKKKESFKGGMKNVPNRRESFRSKDKGRSKRTSKNVKGK